MDGRSPQAVPGFCDHRGVYGLAPTKILFDITQNFIFGFDREQKISNKDFVLHDLLPEAKAGIAAEKLSELFEKGGKGMKFDAVVGNPPYQEEAKGTSSSDDPIYHYFMDSAYKISNIVFCL